MNSQLVFYNFRLSSLWDRQNYFYTLEMTNSFHILTLLHCEKLNCEVWSATTKLMSVVSLCKGFLCFYAFYVFMFFKLLCFYGFYVLCFYVFYVFMFFMFLCFYGFYVLCFYIFYVFLSFYGFYILCFMFLCFLCFLSFYVFYVFMFYGFYVLCFYVFYVFTTVHHSIELFH